MIWMSEETWQMLISAILALIGAVFTAIAPSFGWRRSAAKDIELFYQLLPLVNTFEEEFALEKLRMLTFMRVDRNLVRIDKNVRRGIKTFLMSFFLGTVVLIVWLWGAGRYLGHSPFSWTDMLVFLTAMAFFVVLSLRLRKGPKFDWNPLYREARSDKLEEELLAKTKELYEFVNEKNGWSGDYIHYREARRREWGFRPSCATERERCHAEGETDSMKDRANGEPR